MKRQPATAGPVERPHTAEARAPFGKCGYQVTTDGVRLRTGPGSRYPALGQLHRGDMVDATQARSGWYKVRLAYDSGSDFGMHKTSGLREGTTGWMAKRYARPDVCMQTD
ncbi:SH3 domain-containing protein [Streptomyces sp. AGS-58]|uniref:SH3 domain-containing protein n=1 Tax=unclassified Streptomyces TaxID=2593676 RepID=UPI0035A3470B